MDDLVTRLRQGVGTGNSVRDAEEVMGKAAAEIELLREESMELKEAWHGRCAIIDMKDDEIERLRAALKEIVALQYDHVAMVDIARNTLEDKP